MGGIPFVCQTSRNRCYPCSLFDTIYNRTWFRTTGIAKLCLLQFTQLIEAERVYQCRSETVVSKDFDGVEINGEFPCSVDFHERHYVVHPKRKICVSGAALIAGMAVPVNV
jgi:hypothetical protein